MTIAKFIEPFSNPIIGDHGENLGTKTGGGFWTATAFDESGNIIATGKGKTEDAAILEAEETAGLEEE